MKETIRKSKWKNNKLLHRIVINEKEIIDKKTIMEKFNHFFVNIRPKLASKIPVSNTHFEQYATYEGPILKNKGTLWWRNKKCQCFFFAQK